MTQITETNDEKQTTEAESFIVTLAKILSGELVKNGGEPDMDVGKSEKVHGVLTDPVARSLFSFRSELNDRMKREVVDRVEGEEPPDEEKIKLLRTLEDITEQSKLASGLFWRAVKEKFPSTGEDGDSVGIRKGWQVVTFEKPDSRTIEVISLSMPIRLPPGLAAALCGRG